MPIDLELLISRLSAPLAPADQLAFRQAAERALGAPGLLAGRDVVAAERQSKFKPARFRYRMEP